ncbi:hypothetical protein A3K73_07715 [Candidatus Pacearchaeota archaeon RBG_13_36_9]|nr:MAG: hypothetical protein A3K73_07715 [Candidatus Pacearchaeota archaeon RBG_13_36_9]
MTISFSGCNSDNSSNSHMTDKPAALSPAVSHPHYPYYPSYRLEDLCDKEIDWKDIKIYVHIEDSKILWDYKQYRAEIFGHVRDFFRENLIDCRIVYSQEKLSPFQSSNEFGVEILDSDVRMRERFAFLLTGINFDPNETKLLLERKGYAATRAGVTLINGGLEEFKEMIKSGDMSIKEVEDQYPGTYRGTTVRRYLFKGYAANICHELGHCMTLAHPGKLSSLVSDYEAETPNLMSYQNPVFSKKNSIGYCLTPLQQKLIHSFIAGGNNYRAFLYSERDLDIYLESVAQENKLSAE